MSKHVDALFNSIKVINYIIDYSLLIFLLSKLPILYYFFEVSNIDYSLLFYYRFPTLVISRAGLFGSSSGRVQAGFAPKVDKFLVLSRA